MDKRVSYLGQLYRGEPQTKSWSQLIPGQVSIHLLEGEGRAAGEWKLAAFKKDKVWECRLDPRTKFRAKKDFLQWQTKGGGGEPVTYGIRLKDSETATQLNDRITEVLNAMMSKPPEGDEVQLRVLFSSREPTLLTVRNSTTMIQLLRMFCQKCQLEHTQFIIAPPSDSAHHPPLKPSTTVGSLKTKEVQVVRKGSRAPPTGPAPHPPPSAAPIEATDSINGLSANEQLVQVELPRDERTKIRVSPQVTISQLLRLICEKRNLEVSDHRFDLPATEESLAGKTLEQLKITSIRVIMREEAKKRLEQQKAQEAVAMEQISEGGEKQESQSPSRSKRKSTRRNKIESSAGESPKGNRRQAPPPPPPLQTRRSQPCLIKELAVAAEKKATLRRVGQSSDHEETPPEMRSTRTINSTYHHHGDHDKDSECSTEGTPEQERKTKVPLLPSTSRSALQPRSFPPPPLPPAASKATPTSADIAPPPGTTKTSNSDGPHKTIAPPPVAEKPKKKRVTSLEGFDEPDSAPHPYQAPPTQPEEEVEHPPPPPDMVGVVDMDTLIEEAATVETPVKKTKKKVKKKHTSEDGSAGTATGQKEKKTKSGKTTKKKKKISSQPVDISEVGSLGELRQEESLEREVSPHLEDPSSLLPPPPPPPVLTEEDRQLLEREAETHHHHHQQPEEPSPPSLPPHFEQPAAMPSSSLKQLSPDVKQRNTASLRRRLRGPAPPPPPPGSKTMTLGRIRPSGAGGEHRDITTKSRGFTVLGAATESSREHHPRPASDEIITKPRSVSDALPTPSERESIATMTSSRTPVGNRHRPTRKAPSRPAPATPPTKGGDVKVDEGKSAESRPKSLTGSPRRPPPNVPTAAPPPPPPTTTDDEDRDTDTVRMDFKDDHGNDSGEFEENSDASPHNRNKESEEGESDNAMPPSTPPKPRGDQRWSPGQSPSGGRRKEAATVICKDTEDGGKELIVKPSPHSKRRFAGPLVFKMPPPPSAPPSKAKAKKPPPPISAKPGKRDGTGSSVAETHSHDIYAESADSSVSESVSDTPGELASSVKASSPPKSLSDTLVSNEFTNLDELLSDSQQDNIATTDFSIEENLEPINEYNGLEWNNSGLADSDSIPYQDPDLETAAALNFNSNNNNNYLVAEDDYNHGDFPPPPEIPPPLLARSGEDSDEWERDSNRTGELNFDSDSSTAELSKHSIEDGIVVLDEEAGPGGVVLLNVKRTDSPVFPDELEQIDETASDNNGHLIPDPPVPAAVSIARDPSIGAQLNELDDVVSSLAELAAEVPSLPPPAPPTPPPAPSLLTPSQPYPITTSTPTQQQEGEEHRPSSPEPPPIPLTLPPSLSDNEDLDDDDDFPIGPPPPLVTSEPPSLTPSPPSSPLNDSRTSEKEQQQEDRDFELLNKLKQRQVKGSSSWRRRRGSRDQEAVAVDDGESELLEKLKQRQTLYKQKAKARREEQENQPSSTMEHASGPHSIPSQPPGMGTGTGGDTVQLQLQFLQQQVLQQQMMQLQQQFQNLHSYALQQGVSMPTNMMQVPPGMGGATMLNQQAAFMTTPMAPPTGVAAPQPQQQVVMQTSSGPVLVPAASVAQMMPVGQGVMPNPQAPPPVQQQQNLMGGQLPGQGFAPNAVVYGQGMAQPQTQPPLMSTSVATSQPVVYGQGVSQASAPPPLPQSQPPAMATTSIASNQPITHGQGVSQDAEAPPPPPPTAPPTTAVGISSSNETGTGTKVTPARMLSQQKKRSEDVRALVLGPLEEQFDSLMDQVRDSDPTAVLKKIPEDEEEEREEPSSSYTGMAAALAEALKQRRLHVADKRQSLGELDESNSEWQSP